MNENSVKFSVTKKQTDTREKTYKLSLCEQTWLLKIVLLFFFSLKTRRGSVVSRDYFYKSPRATKV